MRERFHNAMKGRYAPVTFGTFHAVFFTILKAAYHYTAENILREEEKYTILRDILEPMDLEIEDEKEFLLGVTEEISLIQKQSGYRLSIIILLIARKMCSAVFSENISRL